MRRENTPQNLAQRRRQQGRRPKREREVVAWRAAMAAPKMVRMRKPIGQQIPRRASEREIACENSARAHCEAEAGVMPRKQDDADESFPRPAGHGSHG